MHTSVKCICPSRSHYSWRSWGPWYNCGKHLESPAAHGPTWGQASQHATFLVQLSCWKQGPCCCLLSAILPLFSGGGVNFQFKMPPIRVSKCPLVFWRAGRLGWDLGRKLTCWISCVQTWVTRGGSHSSMPMNRVPLNRNAHKIMLWAWQWKYCDPRLSGTEPVSQYHSGSVSAPSVFG